MNLAVLGVGSNIRPDENIPLARKLLQEKVTLLRETEWIQTKPIGYLDQDDFMNGAILVETDMDQRALNTCLKSLEKQLGRKPQSNRNGPRPIDLDILVWNHMICDEDVYQRDFLRQFVDELSPEGKRNDE